MLIQNNANIVQVPGIETIKSCVFESLKKKSQQVAYDFCFFAYPLLSQYSPA